MKVHEGASRLRRAGPWIAIVSLAVNVWLLCRRALVAHYHPGTFDLDPLNFEMIALAIPGALLWPAGWILEGFAKEAS